MSGSVAGRYYAGLSYDPRMAGGGYRLGQPRNALAAAYTAPPGSASFAPVAGYGAGYGAGGAPTLSGGTGQMTGGAGAGPAMRQGWDSDNNNANQDTGAVTAGYGAPSTGNFMTDLSLAAPTLGPAAMGMLSGPMGIAGLGIAGMAAGAARGMGYKGTANDIFNAAFGSPVSGDLAGGGYGKGEAAPGTEGAPAGGFGDQTGTKPDALEADSGAGMGGDSHGGVSTGSSNDPGGVGPSGGDYGGDGAGASAGDTPGDQGGTNTGSSNDGWRDGGYTGHGGDGMVDPHEEADGPVHEGEYVVRNEATHHYGPAIMDAINRGLIPKNALAALVAQRRPMNAANHLLQMMHHG